MGGDQDSGRITHSPIFIFTSLSLHDSANHLYLTLMVILVSSFSTIIRTDKNLLSAYYVSNTVLGAGNAVGKIGKNPCP